MRIYRIMAPVKPENWPDNRNAAHYLKICTPRSIFRVMATCGVLTVKWTREIIKSSDSKKGRKPYERRHHRQRGRPNINLHIFGVGAVRSYCSYYFYYICFYNPKVKKTKKIGVDIWKHLKSKTFLLPCTESTGSILRSN